MNDINNVTLTCRLGHKPEVRFTQGGMAVVECSVCSSRSAKNKSGVWETIPMWFKITLFGKQAEYFAQNTDRGTGVIINGSLSSNQWTDKQGVKKEKISILVDSYRVLASGANKEPANEVEFKNESVAVKAKAEMVALTNEDIPF